MLTKTDAFSIKICLLFVILRDIFYLSIALRAAMKTNILSCMIEEKRVCVCAHTCGDQRPVSLSLLALSEMRFPTELS